MDGHEDAPEQSATDSHLRQLKRDGTGMADEPRTVFDQPCLEAGQRPVCYLFRQISALQEDPEIVCQRRKLKPNLVLRHPFCMRGASS